MHIPPKINYKVLKVSRPLNILKYPPIVNTVGEPSVIKTVNMQRLFYVLRSKF